MARPKTRTAMSQALQQPTGQLIPRGNIPINRLQGVELSNTSIPILTRHKPAKLASFAAQLKTHSGMEGKGLALTATGQCKTDSSRGKTAEACSYIFPSMFCHCSALVKGETDKQEDNDNAWEQLTASVDAEVQSKKRSKRTRSDYQPSAPTPKTAPPYESHAPASDAKYGYQPAAPDYSYKPHDYPTDEGSYHHAAPAPSYDSSYAPAPGTKQSGSEYKKYDPAPSHNYDAYDSQGSHSYDDTTETDYSSAHRYVHGRLHTCHIAQPC